MLEKAVKDAYDAGIDTDEADGEALLDASVEENTEEPDTFEYVSDDEAYVEGRWIGGGNGNRLGHVDCITTSNLYNVGAYFTTDQKNLLKAGVVAPDMDDKYDLHGSNPEWHGLYKEFNNSKHRFCNYIGTAQVQTLVAIYQNSTLSVQRSNMDSLKNSSNYRGIDKDMYEILLSELYSNDKMMFGTKQFADVFTIVNEQYEKITHDETIHGVGKTCDKENYLPGRFYVAKQLASIALGKLISSSSVDFSDFYSAFYNSYYYNYSTNSDYNFKVGYLRIFAKNNCEASGNTFAQNVDTILSAGSCQPVIDPDWTK